MARTVFFLIGCCLYLQINKANFDLHLNKNDGSVNLTKLMRDVVEKAELVVPNDLGNTGLQILAGAINQKHTKVRMRIRK